MTMIDFKKIEEKTKYIEDAVAEYMIEHPYDIDHALKIGMCGILDIKTALDPVYSLRLLDYSDIKKIDYIIDKSVEHLIQLWKTHQGG